MIKKLFKYGKIAVALTLIMALTLPSYATVGASDGSAFVTKAEFDAALSDFNARLTTFEAGINSKIDSQVSSYLDRNGIWNGQSVTPENFILIKNEQDVFPITFPIMTEKMDKPYIKNTDKTIELNSSYIYAFSNAWNTKEFNWDLHQNMPKSGLVFVKYSWGWTGQLSGSYSTGTQHDAIIWYEANKNKTFDNHTRYSDRTYTSFDSGNGFIVVNNMNQQLYNHPFGLTWTLKFKRGTQVLNSHLLNSWDLTPAPIKTYNAIEYGAATLGEGHLFCAIDSFFVSKGDHIKLNWFFGSSGRTQGGVRCARYVGTGSNKELNNYSEASGWCRFIMDIENVDIY